MRDVQWLEELGAITQVSAPEIPTAGSCFWIVAQAVQWAIAFHGAERDAELLARFDGRELDRIGF